MMKFRDGVLLSKVYFPGEDEGLIQVGEAGVTKIAVIMEPGQMAMVPWFGIWKDDVLVEQWNASLMLGAEFVDQS